MPTWVKVLLILGGLLLVLIVAVVVVTYFVVSKYGPGFMEAGKQGLSEGTEYGQRTDNEGCVNEAAARHARVHGLTDTIKSGLFVRACLEASRPTPGFCDSVPGRLEFMKSARWQLEQCERYGLKPEQQCGQLFQQVQQFCEIRGRFGGTNQGGAGNTGPPVPAR